MCRSPPSPKENGTLVRSETPGIYRVVGIMDLPLQIVIISELRGEEYAAYRALTDRADALDVERIIEESGKERDDTLKEHYRVFIRLVIEKKTQFIEVIRRDSAMEDILMEIVKDRVDERISTAEMVKEQETTVIHIRDIMDSFGVTIEKAMDSLKIPSA